MSGFTSDSSSRPYETGAAGIVECRFNRLKRSERRNAVEFNKSACIALNHYRSLSSVLQINAACALRYASSLPTLSPSYLLFFAFRLPAIAISTHCIICEAFQAMRGPHARRYAPCTMQFSAGKLCHPWENLAYAIRIRSSTGR